MRPPSIMLLAQLLCKPSTASDWMFNEDLASYITRPELHPPLFNVKIYDPAAIAPGYWFVAPYNDLKPEKYSRKYSPCQVGPHIYDDGGELVWSGACIFENRNAFDFKPLASSGEDGMHNVSMILGSALEHGRHMKGMGIILNNSLEIIQTVPAPRSSQVINMHEFNIVDDGKHALTVMYEAQFVENSAFGGAGPSWDAIWIGNNGFQEVDIASGEVRFQWWALDHVDPSESVERIPLGPGSSENSWDFFHLNSVDKNAEGDYLISARNTNGVYKISGGNGTILWRLGGTASGIKTDGFSFSRQHDARFQKGAGSTTTISLLDNAVPPPGRGSEPNKSSSVVMIELNNEKSPPTARLLRRYSRPDGGISQVRGNAQVLQNGNIFVNWAQDGYISEFTQEGQCVMEARFLSPRFTNYRAYKHVFKSSPLRSPILKAHAYGQDIRSTTTVFHMSWNGATEVRRWRLCGTLDKADDEGNYRMIGETRRMGFETTFMVASYYNTSYVQALDANDGLLGQSSEIDTVIPESWTTIQRNVASTNDPASSKETSEPRHSMVTGWALSGLALPLPGSRSPTIAMVVLAIGGVVILIFLISQVQRRHRGRSGSFTVRRQSL